MMVHPWNSVRPLLPVVQMILAGVVKKDDGEITFLPNCPIFFLITRLDPVIQ